MHHSNVRSALFATSLVLALGLVGCGGDNDAATDNTASQATSSQTGADSASADVQVLDEAGLRKQIIDHTVTGSMSTGGD